MGSQSKKSICIVGAGPAGLVAAKTFLATDSFDVTLYEKRDKIGGIWALDETTEDGFLSPNTPTNLSRFTVSFGDLDWNEVDIQSVAPKADTTNKATLPTFPKAWQVNRYLQEYQRRHVSKERIHLRTKVLKAEPERSKSDISHWRIETIHESTGAFETKLFDYLIIGSGVFAAPRPPQQNIPGLSTASVSVPTIHSTRFRSLEDLFPGEEGAQGRHILMVGGGNSAGETAAAVAMQLSDAAWSTDPVRRKRFEGCKIVHVAPRPFYALPPYVEYEKGSMSYVPLDFRLYDFGKRPSLDSYGGQQTPQARDIGHNALRSIVGGDQSELGSQALVAQGEGPNRGSVYVALAETYAEFVRDGLIDVKPGRVFSLSGNDSSAEASVRHGDEVSSVENIGAIIYATGFNSSAALDFLADDVKQALHYDPHCPRLPIILEQWQTMNAEVPNAAFLGFYEGPYWPMMEMQARLVASCWLDGMPLAPRRPFEEPEKLLQMRKLIKEKALDICQYWFGDYLGYMEDIARHLSLVRNHAPFTEKQGCQSPARFLDSSTEASQAEAIMQDLAKTWQDCIDHGKFVGRAVLRALHGTWDIHRRISSVNPIYSGTLTGQASFHPRFPTKDRSGKSFDMEYLYVEKGTFTTSNGLSMTASRRYVYRYSEAQDKLSIWFVKPDNDLEVDYLFHDLAFVPPAEARELGACVAKADHLCVKDMYWTEYTLPMEAIVLRSFQIKHTVKGPHKDYVSMTEYRRPKKELK